MFYILYVICSSSLQFVFWVTDPASLYVNHYQEVKMAWFYLNIERDYGLQKVAFKFCEIPL